MEKKSHTVSLNDKEYDIEIEKDVKYSFGYDFDGNKRRAFIEPSDGENRISRRVWIGDYEEWFTIEKNEAVARKVQELKESGTKNLRVYRSDLVIKALNEANQGYIEPTKKHMTKKEYLRRLTESLTQGDHLSGLYITEEDQELIDYAKKNFSEDE